MQSAPTTPLMTWMAAVPTPLEADSTIAVSWGCSSPSRTMIDQLGRNTVGIADACSKLTESARGIALAAGTATSSA